MVETPNRKREPVKITNQQGGEHVYKDEREQRFYTAETYDRRSDHRHPCCCRGPLLPKVCSEIKPHKLGYARNSYCRSSWTSTHRRETHAQPSRSLSY